jgi:hypothetical protein
MDKFMEGQKCYNHHCGKLLEEEDLAHTCGTIINFGKYHLCNACWSLFDGQKMRGRFRGVGISHAELVTLGQQMDQNGGCSFTIGHPSEELRYTEDMDEWVSWQSKEKS